MTGALLLLLMQVAQPVRPAQAPVARVADAAPPPTADWPTLPELAYRRRPDPAAGFSDFVHDEVRAGRCNATKAPDGSMTVQIDMAVLVGGTGPIRRIVPRAINCPTVEQYATGLVERMSRDNLEAVSDAETWYHTALSFAWRE